MRKKIKQVIDTEWGKKLIYEDGSVGFAGKDSGAGSDPEPAPEEYGGISAPEAHEMVSDSDPMMKKYAETLRKKRSDEE